MTTENQADTEASEADEVAEIKTLLRKRLLALLRGDAPLRGSTIAQVVKFLSELGELEKKPADPTPTLPGTPGAPAPDFTFPFAVPSRDDHEPAGLPVPGGRLAEDA